MQLTSADRPGRPASPPDSAWRTAAIALAVALTAWAYFWSLRSANPGFTTPNAASHYGYLTDALMAGQLHLKFEPDPRLALLDNPYAGYQGVPELHDASYYNGHYYLYFGPAPVLLLLGPWRLLTHTFLADGVATVVFAFAGFLLGSLLWCRGQWRFFPELPPVWVGFGVLMVGLGNYVFFLIQTPLMYQVPIACAYACTMAGLVALAFALEAESAGRQARGMALASLALGLAVGARPDFLFTLPALLLPLALLWRKRRQFDGAAAAPRLWLAFWTLAPAGAAGALLAAYNWARFGDFLEFGLKYQLASADLSQTAVTSLANLPGGLHDYLLSPPHYFAYFPFLARSADTFGVLPWAPFALGAAALPLTLLSGRLRRDRVWLGAAGFAASSALFNFLAICLVAFRNDRYAVDFLPMATLAALGVMAALMVRRSWPARLGAAALVLAALFTLSQSLLLGLGEHTSPRLGRLLNAPVAAIQHLLGVRYGPLRLEVKFPDSPAPGRSEPLVAVAGGADVIYEQQPDAGHVQFRLFHRGAGGPSSAVIPIDPRAVHAIEIDLGSLYPPPDYPQFAGWPPGLVDALRRRLVVRLDGRTVLERAAEFYPNDPAHTTVGRSPQKLDGEARFSGTVKTVGRGGLPPRDQVAAATPPGALRLIVRFPPFRAVYSEPLVSTGRSGRGDLVYVTYLGPDQVRFGHDCWGYGVLETNPVTFDPREDQVIELDLGSFHSSPGAPDPLPAGSRLRLRFNGRMLVSALRPFHPSAPIDIVCGFNAIRASTAQASFGGPEFQAQSLPSFP